MNRSIFWLALMAALAVAAGYANASLSNSVSAESIETYSVEGPGSLPLGSIYPGTEGQVSANVIVRSNVDWAILAQGSNSGKMKRTLVPTNSMEQVMRIQHMSVPPEAELPLSGVPQPYVQGTHGEITVPTDFKQAVTWFDIPGEYKITVKFYIFPTAI